MVGYVEITSSALIMEPPALEETLGYHFAQDSPFRWVNALYHARHKISCSRN